MDWKINTNRIVWSVRAPIPILTPHPGPLPFEGRGSRDERAPQWASPVPRRQQIAIGRRAARIAACGFEEILTSVAPLLP